VEEGEADIVAGCGEPTWSLAVDDEGEFALLFRAVDRRIGCGIDDRQRPMGIAQVDQSGLDPLGRRQVEDIAARAYCCEPMEGRGCPERMGNLSIAADDENRSAVGGVLRHAAASTPRTTSRHWRDTSEPCRADRSPACAAGASQVRRRSSRR